MMAKVTRCPFTLLLTALFVYLGSRHIEILGWLLAPVDQLLASTSLHPYYVSVVTITVQVLLLIILSDILAVKITQWLDKVNFHTATLSRHHLVSIVIVFLMILTMVSNQQAAYKTKVIDHILNIGLYPSVEWANAMIYGAVSAQNPDIPRITQGLQSAHSGLQQFLPWLYHYERVSGINMGGIYAHVWTLNSQISGVLNRITEAEELSVFDRELIRAAYRDVYKLRTFIEQERNLLSRANSKHVKEALAKLEASFELHKFLTSDQH